MTQWDNDARAGGAGDWLPDSVSELQALQGAMHQFFATLAEVLPKLAQQLDQLVARLDQCSASSDEESLPTQLNAMRSLAVELTGQLTLVLGVNHQIADTTTRAATGVESISTTLDEIRDLAKGLGHIGINASVAACRAGQEGDAFSAMTRELVDLANISKAHAATVQKGSAAIRTDAAELASVQRDAAAREQMIAGQAQDLVDGATGDVLGKLEGLIGGMADSGVQARASVRPMRQIMLSAQHEDIIRQKIDHLILTLEGLQREQTRHTVAGMSDDALSEAHLSLQERVCEIAARLLPDATGELGKVIADVMNELQTVTRTAARLVAMRSDFPDTARLAVAIAAPAETLETCVVGLREDLAAYERCAALSKGLADHIEQLSRATGDLAQLATRLSMLNVLVKIETARVAKLAASSAIAAEISSAQLRFTGFIRTAENGLRQLSRQVPELHRGLAQVAKHHARVEALSDDMSAHAARLSQLAETFCSALDEVWRVGTQLEKTATGCTASLRQLSDNMARFGKLQERFSATAKQSRKRLLDLGDAEQVARAEAASGEMLERLIGHFTVLSHKQIACEVANFEVDTGGEPGELTLF